ncbi:hypothetical protein JKP88DRAFT_236041 [Tribonema minus]|uniref:Uncharacterized protein n=1 Tax=Tribonema minus TaxID=303371 RepID=A0A835ZCV9_9STRA|nr:hypothetical protein JKP88DRAFT_236041 [Tribonema minus]
MRSISGPTVPSAAAMPPPLPLLLPCPFVAAAFRAAAPLLLARDDVRVLRDDRLAGACAASLSLPSLDAPPPPPPPPPLLLSLPSAPCSSSSSSYNVAAARGRRSATRGDARVFIPCRPLFLGAGLAAAVARRLPVPLLWRGRLAGGERASGSLLLLLPPPPLPPPLLLLSPPLSACLS